MRTVMALVLVMVASLVVSGQRADGPPPWAYGIAADAPPAGTPPAPAPAGRGAQPAADDGTMKHLAGSSAAFTMTEIRDAFNIADWYPGDHPPMPDIVAHGHRPTVRGCGLCHYPNGKGRPENAGISGLPNAYFIQQMADFKNGARKSAEPRKANTNIMIDIAKGMTDAEVAASAQYFGSMPWTPWIKVVETQTVPKTRLAGGMFIALGSGTEPLGQRIIEVPEDAEKTELRDARSGWQHQEGCSAGHHRRRQDDAVQCVPRRGSEGPRSGAGHRRPLAELHGAADVRHAARRAERTVGRSDEAGGRAVERGRSDRDRRIYRVAPVIRIGDSDVLLSVRG